MVKQNVSQLSLGWIREKSGFLAFSGACCASGTCDCTPKIVNGNIIPELTQQYVEFKSLI